MSANSVSPLPNGPGRRERHRVQQPQDHGHRHVGGVGVPQPVAQAVQPAAVFRLRTWLLLIQVGDVADLGNGEPPLPRTGRGTADFQRPEAGAKSRSARLSGAGHETPAPRTVDRVPDPAQGVLIDRGSEVDPAHLGREQRMQALRARLHLAPSSRAGCRRASPHDRAATAALGLPIRRRYRTPGRLTSIRHPASPLGPRRNGPVRDDPPCWA